MSTQLTETGAAPVALCRIDSPEWLSARRLGSSDAAAICGLNPWRTPYQVWAGLVGLNPPVEENEAMRWGKILEPVIAGEFSARTGLTIEKSEYVLQHPTHSFATTTCDYFVIENGVKGVLEIKNVGHFVKAEFEGGIGDPAHVQVLHQLAVTGLSFGYVAALLGGNQLVYHRVERDEELIAKLLDIESQFWVLVENNLPPALSAGDNETLAALYPTAVTSAHIDITLPTVEDTVKRFLFHKAEAKLATERADACAAELKALMADNETATVGGYRLSWKNQTRKSYVVNATTFRKFDVKEIKNGSSKE